LCVLDIFKFDPDFEKNEAMYEEIRKEIIGDPGETTDEEAGDEAGSDAEAQQAPGIVLTFLCYIMRFYTRNFLNKTF
jgi:hypothetical protein